MREQTDGLAADIDLYRDLHCDFQNLQDPAQQVERTDRCAWRYCPDRGIDPVDEL